MSFGEKLRAIRKEQNISQEKLAEMLNVSRQAISKWEQGEGYPQTEKLLALAKTLNASLDYLLLDIETNQSHFLTEENTIRNSNGKIYVKTFDGETVVQCYKFKIERVIFTKKNEPNYILNGIDNHSFLGENSTILGWYDSKECAKKEINAISKSIQKGYRSYKLQYCANVKTSAFGVKRVE